MTPPRFRTLSIGDELLFGKTLDTNAHHLVAQAVQHGCQVLGVEIVGDELAAITEAITRAAAQAEVLIITGGLGPTEDDRTRQALAACLGVELVVDEVAWTTIAAYIKAHFPQAAPTAANRRQSLMPRGTEVLINDRGTAPGILAQLGTCRIACLPGVPHEMRAMAARVFACLPTWFPRWHAPASAEIRVAGIGESAVQDALGDLLTSEPGLTVGITAQDDGHLCLRAVGAAEPVEQRLAAIARCLPDRLLPTGCTSIAEALVARCAAAGLHLSAAESCTCGQVLAALGAVPGVSQVLREGLVCYHNDVKTARLGVPAALIARHGVVSEPVVRAMAIGLQAVTGAACALVTSGVAGPDGGTTDKPVGLVHYAVALGDRVEARQRIWSGTRSRIQQRAASAVILLAFEMLGPE